MGDVVRLWDKNSPTNLGTPADSNFSFNHKKIDDSSSFEENISMDKLYPYKDEISTQFALAVKLLDQALKYAEEAFEYLKVDDLLGSDDSTIKLRAILPELYCCRSIGEGYATLIVSLYHGLNNKKSSYTEDQLLNITYSLKRLCAEPFMNLDTALDLVLQLENSHLIVEPKSFEILAEILSV
jgi:hypothetical protein